MRRASGRLRDRAIRRIGIIIRSPVTRVLNSGALDLCDGVTPVTAKLSMQATPLWRRSLTPTAFAFFAPDLRPSSGAYAANGFTTRTSP